MEQKEGFVNTTRRTMREDAAGGISFVEREWASLNSVEITRNAKGETQWSVKAYAADPHDASALAQAIYDTLEEKYGLKELV